MPGAWASSQLVSISVSALSVRVQESSERQVQLERALREKKAVEKELERAIARGPLQHTQTLHELQSRVCAAERERDSALLRLDNEVTQRKRAESGLVQWLKAREFC